MSSEENAGAAAAVDVQHRAPGCFHALLSVLQAPLAQFASALSANASPAASEDGSPVRTWSATGVRSLLQLVRDADKANDEGLVAQCVADEAEPVLQTLLQECEGPTPSISQYEGGIEAVGQLLLAVGASDDAVRQAQALKAMLVIGYSRDQSQGRERQTSDSSEALFEKENGDSKVEIETSAHESVARDSHDSLPPVGVEKKVVVDGEASSTMVLEPANDQPSVVADNAPAAAAASKHETKQPHSVASRIESRGFDEAINQVNLRLHATKKVKRRVILLEQRAQRHFELEQFSNAYEDSQEALKLDKTRVDAYRWGSAALFKLGRISEAHSTCSAGRKLSPSNQVLKELEKEISREALAAGKKRATVTTPPAESNPKPKTEEPKIKTEAKAETATKRVTGSIQEALKLLGEERLLAAHASLTQVLSLVSAADGSVASKVKVLGHRARCRLSLGMFELAIDDAKEGLQLRPEWLEGHRLACRGLVGLQRWPEALVECEAVLCGAPKDVEFISLAKTIQGEISASEPAQGAKTEACTQESAWQLHVKELIATGLDQVEHGKYAAAHTSFTEALAHVSMQDGSSAEQKANQLEILGHRSRCNLAARHFKPAGNDARSGIEIQADWAEGYRLLCRALIGTSKWRTALTACELVLKYAPQDTVFLEEKAILETKSGVSGATSASATDVDALTAAQFDAFKLETLGLFGVAETRYSDAIALDEPSSQPLDDRALQMANVFASRARCRVATCKYELALEDARTALTFRPQWAEAHRRECVALMKLGRWQEALTACQHVLDAKPTDVAFQAHMATISQQLSQLESSPPRSPSLPVSSPHSVASNGDTNHSANQLKIEASALMKDNDLDAAESKFSERIVLLGDTRSKKHYTYFGERALCRLKMEKFHEAIEDAKEALVCRPDWTEGLRLLCRAFVGLEEWQKASDICYDILSAAPQDGMFQTIRTQIDTALQHEDSKMAVKETRKAAEATREEQTVTSAQVAAAAPEKATPVKTPIAASSARADLTNYASRGSIVAQRYVAAQGLLQSTRVHLQRGSILSAFDACSDALVLWPHLEIPRDVAKILRSVMSHNLCTWGGPMLYFYLEATETRFPDYLTEREFWRRAVERFPDYHLIRTQLALVLYRGNEHSAALDHTEEVLRLASECDGETFVLRRNDISIETCRYLRAMCLPVVVPASPLSWLTGILSSQPNEPTRGSELLTYIQRHTVDDEWMPHACYSLGVLHLNKHEYIQATQFYFLANEAEIRRAKLRLFPEIDDKEFPDKMALQAAVTGPNAVLSLSQQYEAVKRLMACTWCNQSVAVSEYFEHKLEECIERPNPKTARVSEQVR